MLFYILPRKNIKINQNQVQINIMLISNLDLQYKFALVGWFGAKIHINTMLIK